MNTRSLGLQQPQAGISGRLRRYQWNCTLVRRGVSQTCDYLNKKVLAFAWLASSNPAALPKKEKHSHRYGDHDCPDGIVAVARMQFWHILKIHSIHTRNKGQ